MNQHADPRDAAATARAAGTAPTPARPAGATAAGLAAEAWSALGGADGLTRAVAFTGPDNTLPSRLPVTALAQATAACAGLAAAELYAARCGGPVPEVTVDSRAAAVAFTSERFLRLDGERRIGMDPVSRFFPAEDGWVRTHGNYPHHRARLRAALGIGADVDESALATAVAEKLARRPAAAAEEAAARGGALAVAVRDAREWAAHPQARAVADSPLVARRTAEQPGGRRLPTPADAPMALPAAGARVLDLTRVIAGPVGTRTLALLGADVLRIDPPGSPELTGQHLDTGFGKRSAVLDLADAGGRAVFERLLADADVLVTGYRPGALDRYGLSPKALRSRYPGLVVARLSAWGTAGPWGVRRGFDSLVQAASGIALAEAAGAPTPGAMPAQALDHGTGYLLAAAVLHALTDREADGRGRYAELSLARTAAWLLGHGAAAAEAGPPAAVPFDTAAHTARVRADYGVLTHALPPFRVAGGPRTWGRPPTPWGRDAPAWAPRGG